MSPSEFVGGIEEWEAPAIRLYPCTNCGAMMPMLHQIGDRRICCGHCFFNREYGVAETWSDYGLGEEYFEETP